MPRRPMSSTILLGVELVEEKEHPVLDEIVACARQAAHGAVVAQQVQRLELDSTPLPWSPRCGLSPPTSHAEPAGLAADPAEPTGSATR
eukprot:2804984-Pyramimonas_sp.AAC.1